MKDKLRELAERWAADADIAAGEGNMFNGGLIMTKQQCAAELLAILDADGDDLAVSIEVVGRVERDTTGDLGVNWSLEGGIHALEEGAYLFCADREITDDEGYGELYIHPARSGVVSEEDVDGALDAYEDSTGPTGISPLRVPMRAALEHFAKGERHER